MSLPRQSLNVHVPWTEIIRVLGLPVHSQALPAQTRCPLCQRVKLRIFQDIPSGGQWHECGHCKSSGDMIELACKVWGLNTKEALIRLSRAGVSIGEICFDDNELTRYIEDHLEYRKRIWSMWEQSQRYLESTHSNTVRSLQQQYRLRLRASRERWRQGPGQLFGALPKNQIEAAFSPNSLNANGCNQSSERAFKGKNWDEVLIFPFFDLPRRIRAFMFLGRSGDPIKDQVYKATNLAHPASRTSSEAGLGCLPAVELAGSPGTVVAVNDWLLALRLHVRTFNTSITAMPLVVWHDDGQHYTRNAWDILHNRRIVFWTWELTAQVLRQAVHTDGLISTAGPDVATPSDVDRYLKVHRGHDLTKAVIRQAKPWRKFLARWVRKVREPQVDGLFLELEALGEDVSAIARQCGRNIAYTDLPVIRRTVEVDGRSVIEKGDKWYAEKPNRTLSLILDASLRVTHAIRDHDSGQLFYRGFVLYQDTKYHFLQLASAFDENIASWIRDFLAYHGAGLVQYSPTWSKRLYEIAAKLHEPQFLDDDVSKWAQKMREAGELIDPI